MLKLDRIQRLLPVVAIAGALLAIIALIAGQGQRQRMLVDDGQTRPAVEKTVASVQELHPSSLSDSAFLSAVQEAGRAQYIATLWLFAPDGRIVYSTGSTRSQGTAQDRAGAETHRVLESMPAGAFSEEQQVWLLAASAIQAEGEHNDVYRHLLRPIQAPDGQLVGLLGVAYEVNPAVSARPEAGWVLTLAALLLGLALYWFSLPVWVFADARLRGERAWAWATFVLIGNLVALLAYVLVRPPHLRTMS